MLHLMKMPISHSVTHAALSHNMRNRATAMILRLAIAHNHVHNAVLLVSQIAADRSKPKGFQNKRGRILKNK